MTWPYELGVEGPGVSGLQEDLEYHGYRIPIDGRFGPTTDEAIRLFQRHEGLDVDGVVGPLTCLSLCQKRIHDLVDSRSLPRTWMLRGIVVQESSYDYGAVGFVHPADKGLVQINLDAPPTGSVSEEEAFRPSFALSYCVDYLALMYETFRGPSYRCDAGVARRAAVAAWHAPAWGQQWATDKVSPNDASTVYVSLVIAKGRP